MKKILAWHFVGENRRLRYNGDDLGPVEPGYVYSIGDNESVKLCHVGMHGSRMVADALRYAPGAILCRTAHWGDVAEEHDKLASRHREVLAVRDVSVELRLWACWCVRQVWHLLTDERSKRAVEVAEAYAYGSATLKELDAARAAARAAAWDAAWDAARDAARDAQATELERRMLALFGEGA